MTTFIVLAAAAIVLLLGGGFIVLTMLAAGPNGPGRFTLAEPDDVQSFIDRGAAFAVTVEVEVPTDYTSAWKQALDGPMVNLAPLYSGPVTDGAMRSYRGVVAWKSSVIDITGGRRLLAVGTGVSVPLAVKSLAEEVVVTPRDGARSAVTYTIAIHPRFVGFLPLRWTAVFVRPFLVFAINRAF